MGRVALLLLASVGHWIGCEAPPPATARSCAGGASIVQLAVGGEHTCTLDENGAVCCWGRNDYGQLGDGTTEERKEPAVVPGLPPAVELAAAGETTCVRHADGTMRCWGDNAAGQLGDGTRLPRLQPRAVPGLRDVARISVGPTRACAVPSDGSLWCWGDVDASSGEGGSTVPVLLPGIRGLRDIVSGGVTTVLLLDHRVVRIQRVLGAPLVAPLEPVDALLPWPIHERVVQLATSCALGANGAVRDCQAWEHRGAFGLQDVAHVSTCSDRGCAAMRDGSVRCWGPNSHQELGFRSQQSCEVSAKFGNYDVGCTVVPQTVPGVAGAVEVRVGNHHACSRSADGAVTCFGIVPPEVP